jgi:hypothetical protein
MSPAEAAAYHAHQIGVFAAAKTDVTTAITMTNASEAIGFVHAALSAPRAATSQCDPRACRHSISGHQNRKGCRAKWGGSAANVQCRNPERSMSQMGLTRPSRDVRRMSAYLQKLTVGFQFPGRSNRHAFNFAMNTIQNCFVRSLPAIGSLRRQAQRSARKQHPDLILSHSDISGVL